MAELRLRRRPSITVKKPARGKAGIPRIPTPKMAGEADLGALVRAQVSQDQNARFSEAKLAASRIAERDPIAAAQYWLDFLRREFREHPDLYPEGSAERANIEAEILSAQQAVTTAQTGTEAARMESELAAGGLTTDEQITLLKKKLATLTPGTEEYYETLAQIRELEQQAKEEAEAAGKRGAGLAWNAYVDNFNASVQKLEEDFQAGRISKEDYLQQMSALVGDFIGEAERRGKDVPDEIRNSNTYLQQLSKMKPNMVFDYYDTDGTRQIITKAQLTESGKGIIQLQDYDPTTGKSTPYPVLTSTKGSGEEKEVGFISPVTGEWTTSIIGWEGQPIPLSTYYRGDISGKVLRTAPTTEKDPTTGAPRGLHGFGPWGPTVSGRETLEKFEGAETAEEEEKLRKAYRDKYGGKLIGSREEAESKIAAGWAQGWGPTGKPAEWEPLEEPRPTGFFQQPGAPLTEKLAPVGEAVRGIGEAIGRAIPGGPPSAQPVQPVTGYQPGLYPAEGEPTALATYQAKEAQRRAAEIVGLQEQIAAGQKAIAAAKTAAGRRVSYAIPRATEPRVTTPKLTIPKIAQSFESITRKMGGFFGRLFSGGGGGGGW